MISPNLKLLLWFMQTGNTGCPPNNLLLAINKNLLKLSLANKSVVFLFHLLECPRCQKAIEPRLKKELKKFYLRSLVTSLIESKEKRKLRQFCLKNNIDFVFIKDVSAFKKLEIYERYQPGSDLDILISLKDCSRFIDYCLSNGYQIQKNLIFKNKQKGIYSKKSFAYSKKSFAYYEEYHLKNKLNTIIDLHTLLTIPHHDELRFLSPAKVAEISQLLLKEKALSKEIFLFSLIIHYLGSDILKGLRSLYDINLFALSYQKEINWEKFFRLCREFEVFYFSIFIFLLGERIFNFKTAVFLPIRIPWRVKYLAEHHPVEKIAVFPTINNWKKNRRAREMFLENLLIKILLGDKTTRLRIFRPKILLFLFNISFHPQE